MVDKAEKEKIKQLVREQISSDDGKLKWMYNSKTDTEEYLLGKRVDKTFEREHELQKEAAATSVGAIFDDDVVAHNVKVDMQVKMREDPLFAIRKREEDARRALLMNPVKMKQLQKMASANEQASSSDRRSKKKEKKSKKHGHGSPSSHRSGDDLLHTYLSLLGKKSSKDREEAIATGGASRLAVHHQWQPAAVSGQPTSGTCRDGAPAVKDRDFSRVVSAEASSKRSTKEKAKKEKKKKARHRSSSSASSESDDSNDDNLLQKYLSLTRGQGAPPPKPAGRTIDDRVPRRIKDAAGDSKQLPEENVEASTSRGRRDDPIRNRSHSRSRSPRERRTKEHGASRDGESSFRSRSDYRSSKHGEVEKHSAPQRREHTATRKLTEEEKAMRRREMMDNAKWHEEERIKNLKKHEEEGKKEEEQMVKGPKSADGFINPLMAVHAQQSSVEDRLKRNRYHIQRTNAALDKNFAQR